MDPLSDVLQLLKPRSQMAAGFDAGGDWSIGFTRHDGIKCYAVVSGQCWLAVDGVPDPVRLRTGDCFILTKGWPFRLASDLDLAPVDAHPVFAAARDGGVVTHNRGGDLFMVGSRFAFDGDEADLLVGTLPPLIHLEGKAEGAALRWSVERMMGELRDPQPGGALVARHLAHMMLVQALRLYLAGRAGGEVGWLFALADRRVGAALSSLHGDPTRRWTLGELADRAGMSRSAFAQRFKDTVGVSPIDYLLRWRMALAGDRLTTSREPVSAIASWLGYDSESAFSTAFKRVMGRPPSRYERGAPPARAPALRRRRGHPRADEVSDGRQPGE